MSDSPSYDMNNDKPSKFKSALNYGAIFGLALLVLSLINYSMGLWENKSFGYLSYAVIIGGIVFGIKKYRDNDCGGYISYGSALGFGVLMIFFASLISSVGSACYLSFIDDTFITSSLEMTEVQLIEQDMPDDQIDMAMSWTKKIMTPIGIIIAGVFSGVFFGLIVSLIAAAFLKKESDSFELS